MSNTVQLVRARKVMAFILAGLILCFVCDAAAQEAKKSQRDLAGDATNPAAPLIQFQMQDLYTPSSTNSSGYANTGIIQPVYPYVRGKDNYFQAVIFRLTVPIVTTPVVGGNRTTALGDSTLLTVPAHKKPVGDEGDFWNFGPVLATILPTGSSEETASRKFSMGPGGLVLRNTNNIFTKGDGLLAGALAYQTWSVATVGGERSHPDVSKLYFQPLVVYRFSSLFDQKGWYARLPDDLSIYDWEAEEFTQVPVGGGIGRVFSIGKQPVNMFAQGWHNAVSSRSGVSADYTIKLNFTFLFPTG